MSAIEAHVFVSRRLTPGAMDLLAGSGFRGDVYDDRDGPPARSELIQGVRGMAGLVVSLTELVDREVLAAAGDGLRVVANVAVGVDNIDIGECRQRGVIVTNTPRVLTDATADLTIGLIVDACRRISEGDRLLRSGASWLWAPEFFTGRPLIGATLGIVGYGRIGQAVARRARAFEMKVIATGRGFLTEHACGDGVRVVDLDELLATADIVTVHCPLTAETRHLIGRAELATMKQTAVLVNVARGGVVDESALVRALSDGLIAAAALDVFEDEPFPHPELLSLPNVVMTPHIGSADTRTREEMCSLAVRNLIAVLEGQPAITPV